MRQIASGSGQRLENKNKNIRWNAALLGIRFSKGYSYFLSLAIKGERL